MQKTRNEFRKECEKIILSNKDDATKINELNYKIEEILDRKFCEIVKLLTELNSKISTFLEKASSPSISKRLIERYEKQADDCIDVQTKKQAEVNRLTAQATAITAIKDSCKQAPLLSVDNIFTSDKVSREVVRLFIKRIDVDDNNDDISISFK